MNGWGGSPKGLPGKHSGGLTTIGELLYRMLWLGSDTRDCSCALSKNCWGEIVGAWVLTCLVLSVVMRSIIPVPDTTDGQVLKKGSQSEKQLFLFCSTCPVNCKPWLWLNCKGPPNKLSVVWGPAWISPRWSVTWGTRESVTNNLFVKLSASKLNRKEANRQEIAIKRCPWDVQICQFHLWL